MRAEDVDFDSTELPKGMMADYIHFSRCSLQMGANPPTSHVQLLPTLDLACFPLNGPTGGTGSE